jgi:hypothetical protein
MTSNSTTAGRRRLTWKAALFCLPLLAGLVGCGSSGVAPVSGTVRWHGEPIKGGTLIFSPLEDPDAPEQKGGLPATAEVQPDGTYELRTLDTCGGAKIGRHRVLFTPPPQELTEEQRTNRKYVAPPPLYMGLVPKTSEVEVKAGTNTIDLELVKPGT